MEWKNIIPVLGVLLLLFGCMGIEEPQSLISKSAGGTLGYDYADASYAPAPAMEYSNGYDEGRMVIQEGSLSLKVPEGTLEEKLAAVKGYVSEARGTYTGLSYYEYDTTKNYYLTVKVPPAKFDEFVSKLRTIGEIKSIDTSLEDVTEQYTDINTRISNLESELARLNELYDMARDVEDVLAIEREVTRVQTQLEMYETQKLNLERRSSMSTITVRIYEEKPAVETALLLPLEQLLGVFFGTLSFAILLLVGGLGFLIPVAIIAFILWSVWKHLKRKKK